MVETRRSAEADGYCRWISEIHVGAGLHAWKRDTWIRYGRYKAVAEGDSRLIRYVCKCVGAGKVLADAYRLTRDLCRIVGRYPPYGCRRSVGKYVSAIKKSASAGISGRLPALEPATVRNAPRDVEANLRLAGDGVMLTHGCQHGLF